MGDKASRNKRPPTPQVEVNMTCLYNRWKFKV